MGGTELMGKAYVGAGDAFAGVGRGYAGGVVVMHYIERSQAWVGVGVGAKVGFRVRIKDRVTAEAMDMRSLWSRF